MPKKLILLVDDDPLIRDLLQEYLEKNQFQVLLAKNQTQAFEKIKQQPCLVLLDVMLPDGNGLFITEKLQQDYSHIPILLISAKGESQDVIAGLQKGADDYLPKPFDPLELLLRIEAILRRVNPPSLSKRDFVFGEFRFDKANKNLYKNKHLIKLTKAEKLLLNHFVKHTNQCLNRQQLMDAIALNRQESFDRSIDIHITRLRKKIEENPKKPRWILTEWGLGYVFCYGK
jgi:two-component system phosphate regulon response regulator OmpR